MHNHWFTIEIIWKIIFSKPWLYDVNGGKNDLLKNESRYKLFCPYIHENQDDWVILTMQTKFPEKWPYRYSYNTI